MKNIKLIFIAIILTISFINSVYSQNDTVELEKLKIKLREEIEKQMKSSKVTGLSIAIVDNQEILWAEGFGFADKENNIRATENTVYRVGSISKLFTATALMQLSDEKKLDIDEEVKTYIPEFDIKSRFSTKIIIRDILTHHSGLPSDIFKDFFSDDSVSFETIIDDLNNEYTCQPANYIHSYSNPGFTLLGCVVERVSGQSFFEYTQEHLFIPMEMNNSGYELSSEMKKLYAKGYLKEEPMDEPYIRDVPAGMLQTNVLDLANFIKMTFNNGKFNDKKILDSLTLVEMQSPQNLEVARDLTTVSGLCWFLTPENDEWSYAGGTASHGGDTYVYHAELVTLPEEKMGVIVITNSSSGASLVRKIANDALEDFVKIQRGLTKPEEEKTKVKLNKKSGIDFSGFEGDYAIGGTFTPIYKKGKYLQTKINGIKLALIPNSKGTFSPQIRLLGIIRIPIKSQQMDFVTIENQDYFMIINKTDSMIIGEKIEKIALSETWTNRCGKYLLMNDSNSLKMMKDLTISENNGVISVAGEVFNGGKMNLCILPINENEAIVQGIGRQSGYTVKFIDDKFYISGLEFEKVVN